jgi:hypothetical protein
MEQPEKHQDKNVWGSGGSRAGQYHRHSVSRDVKFFMGWHKLDELFTAIKSQAYQNVGITAFKLAARITEALQCRKNMFIIDYDLEGIIVPSFPILKLWKATDKVIICQRCGVENSKFEMACIKCGANLVFSGKKKFRTERVIAYREPFVIPLSEKYSDRLIAIIDRAEDLLFPSPYTDKPYTRQWAYAMVKEYGPLVGLSNLYNHFFRSQRDQQLKEERGFTTEERKAFTGIQSDTTDRVYTKEIISCTKKFGLDPEKLKQALTTRQMAEQQDSSSRQASSADSSKKIQPQHPRETA